MKGATASTNALVVPEAHVHQLLTAPRVALLLKEAVLVKDGLAGVSRANFLEVVHLHDFVLRLPEELLLCEARLTALVRRLRVKCRAENGITAWLPTLQELVELVPEEGVACTGASEKSP
ncbi:hypothetical protein GH5_00677 [Leishmania sp. Ghana 2012 LV757]|uniref:hypothetical protein n=1 Tax=Leishmania sp. Ghana 2012 LV757 TaxID=2803181 RepID=UPI001B55E033|nr:hypothetical protein GH5_00677 [Leishmania sp. Ghana 2012 LV757]